MNIIIANFQRYYALCRILKKRILQEHWLGEFTWEPQQIFKFDIVRTLHFSLNKKSDLHPFTVWYLQKLRSLSIFSGGIKNSFLSAQDGWLENISIELKDLCKIRGPHTSIEVLLNADKDTVALNN